MPQQNFLFVMLAISCQVLSVRSADCLHEFVANQFESFAPQPNLNAFWTNGSNFYILGDTTLSNIEIEHSGTIDWTYITTNLTAAVPYFSVYFVYNSQNFVTGTHSTNGTILSRRRFSGNGRFNASVNFNSGYSVDVKIHANPSGYLDILYIETELTTPWLRTSNESVYFENVSDNEAIKEFHEFIDNTFKGIPLILVNMIVEQIFAEAKELWYMRIPETNLTDICISPNEATRIPVKLSS